MKKYAISQVGANEDIPALIGPSGEVVGETCAAYCPCPESCPESARHQAPLKHHQSWVHTKHPQLPVSVKLHNDDYLI